MEFELWPVGMAEGDPGAREPPVSRERREREDDAGGGHRPEDRVAERAAVRDAWRDERGEDRDRAGDRERDADRNLAQVVLLAEDVEDERLDAHPAEVRDEHEDGEPA